ncbi:hypothetical protein V8C26DRAFT_287511 [Trichoderma gracile]
MSALIHPRLIQAQLQAASLSVLICLQGQPAAWRRSASKLQLSLSRHRQLERIAACRSSCGTTGPEHPSPNLSGIETICCCGVSLHQSTFCFKHHLASTLVNTPYSICTYIHAPFDRIA